MIDFTMLNHEVRQLLLHPMTMQEGVELIRHSLQTQGQRLVTKFDDLPVETEYLQFAEWLHDLLTTEPVPEEVRALHFGLLESPHGVDLYLTGTSEWKPQSLKWRGNNAYVPARKYSPTNLFTQIVKAFGVHGHLWMYLSLGLIILFIQRFVATDGALFFLSGCDHLYCTTGFDEGDLFVIGEITVGGVNIG